MQLSNLEALLLLKLIPKIGPVTSKKLIDFFEKPNNIFKENPSHLKKIEGFSESLAKNFYNVEPLLKKVSQEINFIEKNNITPLCFGEENYPKTLQFCADSPIILFTKGTVNYENQKIISIVGTRNNTHIGKEFCEKLIEELAPINPIIVSGFAYGIDIIAHRAALKNNLTTVACLGHNFDTIYPEDHKKYIPEVMKKGSLITEFMSYDTFDKNNFPKRNRIIAGIAHCTVVIETKSKGGSMITANLAHQYNRDLFAVPGRASDSMSKGCLSLIKSQKAQLITEAKDIIESMGWQVEKEKSRKNYQKNLFITLNKEEKEIIALLNEGQKSLDNIALEAQFNISKTAAILFELELKGAVRAMPGKKFEITL